MELKENIRMVALGDVRCSCGKIFTGDQLGRDQKCSECNEKIKKAEEKDYQDRREEFAKRFLDGNISSRTLAYEIFDLKEEIKQIKNNFTLISGIYKCILS